MPLNLTFARMFGPFKELPAVELPDFSIVTGLNASGKTQLLRALANGYVVASSDAGAIAKQNVLYVSQLVPQLKLSATLEAALNAERNLVKQLRLLKGVGVAPGFPPNQRHKLDKQMVAQLDRIATLVGKKAVELLEEEVEAYAVAAGAESAEHFSVNIAAVSMGHLRTYLHQMRATGMRYAGESAVGSLLDESRTVLHKPAPWILISSILKPFGFVVEGPEVSLASAQSNLELAMQNTSGESVQPSELSGGEQSLLALALAQYGTATGGGFPQLLLLDECLSALHPSVISKALDVIADVFVKKNKTKVILVTHAPSVVALAPTGSVFVASRDASTLHVRATSADEGIGLLTVGVPALRIDLENRHQVFVEGDIDEFVYSRLYEVLRKDLDPVTALAFVACGGRREGGCDRVTHLVKALRAAGNKRIRGLVDSDGNAIDGNTRDVPEGVEVLCRGERDALQNLMLDPLLLAFTLGLSERGREYVGGVTQTDLREMDNQRLQLVTDRIVSAIADARGGKNAPVDGVAVEYIGGRVVQIPAWILSADGHEYAEWVLGAFPVLNKQNAGTFGSTEDKIVAGIAADVVTELRDYLPASLLGVFRRLQSKETPAAAGQAE